VVVDCGAPPFGDALDRVLCTLLIDHLSPIGETAGFCEAIVSYLIAWDPRRPPLLWRFAFNMDGFSVHIQRSA
jgi:hypothetical protein